MFRPMRRKKQELPREEALEVLRRGKRGVLGMTGDDGWPYAVPVNYVLDPDGGRIWLHGAKAGHKVDAILNDPRVCFTTWDEGELDEADGWSYHVRSVTAFGTAELVDDAELALQKARALGLKYYPDAEQVERELRRDGARVQMIAVRIEHLTGKRVHEK